MNQEYRTLETQRSGERKSLRRKLVILGCLMAAIMVTITTGLLININRLTAGQDESLAKIDAALDELQVVQDNQNAGVERSYVILGTVQCTGQANAKYNADLANFLAAAIAEDPSAEVLLVELQESSAAVAEQCAAASLQPPEVPEGQEPFPPDVRTTVPPEVDGGSDGG